MSPRLAVIHPEGNFPNNPHLDGLLELLLERGHAVDVLCRPHVSHAQASRRADLRVLALPVPPGPVDPPRSALFGPGGSSAAAALAGLPRYDLVLGVDLGVVEAAWVARAQGTAHGLISYELYFADESPRGFKNEEIDACRDVAFAVCQDTLRAGLLARENALDPATPLFTMPVAGRGARAGKRSFALHEALGLPRSVKLALAMGSADAPWTGTRQVLANVARWPRDWVLVLHHRFDQAGVARLREGLSPEARNKVFVSPFPSLPGRELGRLLHACDLGLAFYTPTYDAPLLGKNLEHIGMASGKFSTCLQHGLPVVVSDRGEMGRHVEREGLGWRVDGVDQTHSLLEGLDRERLDARRPACLDFFSRALDLDALAGPFLDAVDAACAARAPRLFAGTGASGRTPGDADEPGSVALLARARLALALDRPEEAAQALGLAARQSGSDLESAHLLSVELARRGRPDLAAPVFRMVSDNPETGARLAAWALFKEGETAEQAGDPDRARALYGKALARDPAHAKAALALAPQGEPLRVRLCGGEGACAVCAEGGPGLDPSAPERAQAVSWLNVPMDPLDQGLWDYYFARRAPDHVVLGLPSGAGAADLARLAALLARGLAPAGRARVRLGGGRSGSGPGAEAARGALSQAGLVVERQESLTDGTVAVDVRAPGGALPEGEVASGRPQDSGRNRR